MARPMSFIMMTVFFIYPYIGMIWASSSLVRWDDMSLLENAKEKVSIFISHSTFLSQWVHLKIQKMVRKMMTLI